MDKGSFSILHIILAVRETSAPYNEHCLPWSEKRDTSICTFFASDNAPPKTITLFEGDGTLKGFLRSLDAALAEKKYDVIHAHSPHVGLLFQLGARFTSRKPTSPTVFTVHDSYPNYKLRNRLLLLSIFATYQRVVCCSQSSLDSFPPFYKLLARDRLRVVQNGLDLDRVDRVATNLRKTSSQTGEFTTIAISRLVGIKNPFAVISAYQQSTNHNGRDGRLVYIGDGSSREVLVRKSVQFGLEDQIEFTGLIPRELVFERLLSADLFISTSRGEGLPVAVLEAMACGCPVILSDIPPHREISEGVDFIPLIHPDDINGFAQEIKRFRDMTASERNSVGQKCRELVEERFSLESMHSGYNEIYAQITNHDTTALFK